MILSTCSTLQLPILNTNQSTQEVKKERYLIKTRQNKVQTFGKFCLQHSNVRTNGQNRCKITEMRITILKMHTTHPPPGARLKAAPSTRPRREGLSPSCLPPHPDFFCPCTQTRRETLAARLWPGCPQDRTHGTRSDNRGTKSLGPYA